MPAAKYRIQSGMASTVIVMGSGVGVNAAVKRNIKKTAIRQGLSNDRPLIKPRIFNESKSSGRTKATPNSRINLITKSKYSSNLMRFPKSLGVKPSKIFTACGKIKYAQVAPKVNNGVAAVTKNIAKRRSFLCKAGVIKAQI